MSVAITGYFVGQYATGSLAALGEQGVGLAATYADRPVPVQAAFYAHITFAGLALVAGPFQFATMIRRRWPVVHRWIGRTYLASIALGAPAALVMSFFSSAAVAGFFGFGTLALLWAWTSYRGYRAIRNGDIASHQAWMIRSFALTFAAPTLRLWLGVLMGAQLSLHLAPAADAFTNAYAVVPFLCWLPNIVVAEMMIRRRDLPGLRFSSSPAARSAAAGAAGI
ncbi:DUF2306 domain-containing protein [Mangrovihabitans endophyticus]|uniref:DUF2306 domain-containing protein n=1 Tax=Mangrovihabitans endophyticus TaxID=1751298 RepID=UPI001E5D4D92|nr:DUF2306 domain-containing protein [Mangrovihabitans endophyticus]